MANGFYQIVNAADTSLAMDVWGASDQLGANVGLYKYARNADSQLAFVVTMGDGWMAGYTAVHFPLTGHVLDNAGNSASAGANVQAWDWTTSQSNQWRLEATGRKATVGGTSYDTYRIRPRANAKLCVDPQGTSAPKSGDNLQTYTDVAYTDVNGLGQEWAFVPVQPAFPQGTWKIYSAVEATLSRAADADHPAGSRMHLALDVQDAVYGNGSNVQLWVAWDTNAQVWRTLDDGDGTTRVLHAQTGYALDASDGGSTSNAPSNGRNVQLWAWGDGTHNANQKWVVDFAGAFGEVNGCKVPLMCLRSQWGSGVTFFLDAYGGDSQPGRNATLWDASGYALGRMWAFLPDSFEASDLPVATRPRFYYESGKYAGRDGTTLSLSGARAARVCWGGPAGCGWQARYRLRQRLATQGVDARGGWGPWRNLADGTTANFGLGRADRPNVSVTEATVSGARRLVSSTKLSVARPDGVDLVQAQVEVRSMAASHGATGAAAHGAPVRSVLSFVEPVEASVSEAMGWTPEGLHVTVSSGLSRAGSTYKVEAWVSGRLRGAVKVTGGDVVGADGRAALAAVVPLDFMPADGSDVTVWATVTSPDGATGKVRRAGKVAWDAHGAGLAISPKVSAADGFSYVVDPGDAPSPRLWAVWDGGSREVEAGDDGRFVVLPPLGMAWELSMCASKGGKWDTWSRSFPREAARHSFMWNFDDDGTGVTWAGIKVAKDARPTESVTVDSDYDAQTRAGGGMEVVTMPRARKVGVSVGGHNLPEIDGDDWERRLDALEACGFAWFRDCHAHLWRVAVTTVTRERDAPAWKVGVDMRRVG